MSLPLDAAMLIAPRSRRTATTPHPRHDPVPFLDRRPRQRTL